MLTNILTLAWLIGLSKVSPWAFSRRSPRLDNAMQRIGIGLVFLKTGNCAQCFLSMTQAPYTQVASEQRNPL